MSQQARAKGEAQATDKRSANAPLTIVGLGELLWDVFPSGRQLGGAPANFAYCSHLLGDSGTVVSRVGADELGNDIRESLASFGLSDDFVQSDEEHPTGTVKVKLDKAGQPDFTITYPSAWDFLEWNPALEHLAKSADAVAYGSLAQRSPQSRRTIGKFLDTVRKDAARVFDVNLRQSFYSAEVLRGSFSRATIVKLNQDEVPKVAELLGFPGDTPRSFCQGALREFKLPLICVTRGELGSLLVSGSEEHEHQGYRVRVRDTVGSGDAFTAALVNRYLHGGSLADANDFANRMGAWLASNSGAMPAAPDEGLLAALAEIG
jgi:fructokinase